MEMDDQEFTARDYARARFIIARWNKTRALPRVGWSIQDTFDLMRFNDERALISMVGDFAGADMESGKPYSLALDGRRYIVFPEPDSTSIANATLVVQDVETGEEVACCPGQFADVTIDAD